MLTRRAFAQLMLTLPFSSALLTSCTSSAPMRVAIHEWIGYNSFYLAEAQAKLPESVSLIKLRNNSEKMEYTKQGLVDAGTYTLDEVLQLRSQGIPLTIVAILDISAGADVVLVRSDEHKNLVPIQANQRIAYEPTQIGELMLDLLLDRLDLTREQMRLIPLPVGEDQLTAWQRGAVDIVITYEPYASQLTRLGAKVAYSSKDFPQRIFDVFAVRTDRLARMEVTLRQLLRAHFAMLASFKSNRDEAIYSMAARDNLTYDEIKNALNGIILPSVARNRALLEQHSSFYEAVKLLNQLMVSHQQMVKPDNLADLMTSAYLPGPEFDNTTLPH